MDYGSSTRRSRRRRIQDSSAADIKEAIERSTPSPEESRKKRRRGSLLIYLIILGAVLAVILLATPWQPETRAFYTPATEDGAVGAGMRDEYYTGLRISEIMPSNHTSVPDDGGNYPDWIEVWNSSDRVINLQGVGLSDRDTSIRFLFPDIDLQPDARVVVFCDNTNQVDSGRPMHAKFKLSSVGETVYLFDPNAFQIDAVTYRILSSDTSWALLSDDRYHEVDYFSPGYANTEEGHQSYRTDTMVTAGELIINEVMPSAKSGLTDEDGEFSDWVELYNTTDRAISLDNFALSDKETKPLKWRFPQGAVVAPHGYYLVFCSGKDRRSDATSIPHTNFSVSAEHDTIVLSDSNGHLVDRVTVDNIPADCTYARDPNGVFSVHLIATPGRDNADIAGADLDLRAQNRTGVYISEVMASNHATAIKDLSQKTDWVEIYNSSGQTVDLSGWGLSDDIKRPRRWQFPAGYTIGPGEYKIVLCDGSDQLLAAGSTQHTNFKIKRAGGETVCLSDPQGHVLDRLVLPEVPTDNSYGRTLGMSGFFYYDVATPGAANGTGGFAGYAPMPSFTTAPGLYYAATKVAIEVPDGCAVYYTTDGSIPSRQSTPYRGETFELSFTTVLRARAFPDNSNYRASPILTGSFFINAYHTLPIVSVVCDPDELWNPTDGMLVTGDNVVKEPGKLPFKNTIYREFGKIPRPGHVEYYLLDGTQMLSQDEEFSLMGQFSLDMPQKSMKFRARSLYGAKYFDAKLFDDRPYTQYKSFVLRNSGNDCMWTRLLDGFQSRLLDGYGTQVVHQAWNPVVVYINGVYWGHMNMRERVDKYFVAQHEGLTMDQADQITILESNMTLKVGDPEARREYRSMIEQIKKSDPAKNEADLQYILDRVDVDNYFEYLALEMFVGNSDIGNLRMYRTGEPGAKWKWLWYDADYGLYSSSFDSPKSYTKAAGMGEKKINNTIFLKLLTVPEYKDKFLRKLGDIFKLFTTQYMLETLEPLVEQIKPEMDLHWARWGEENDQFVISEVPVTIDGAYRYWERRIERLRNTLKRRPNLLWGYIQDAFQLTNSQMVEYFGERPVMPADAV